jgi:hypothetical protein
MGVITETLNIGEQKVCEFKKIDDKANILFFFEGLSFRWPSVT